LGEKRKNGKSLESNVIEDFETKDIVILMDNFNNCKKIPKFNQSSHSNIISKITGCSADQFKDFINYPYEKKPSERQKEILIKRLQKIKDELNKINFFDADDYINRKINDLGLA